MSKAKEKLSPVEGLSYIRHDPERGRFVVDMSDIGEPSRVFCAHTVRLDTDPDGSRGIFISFGQIVPPRRVTGAVVVQLTSDVFYDFMETMSDEFRGFVERAAQRSGTGFCELKTEEINGVELGRVAVFRAAIGRCSVAATGAQLDWFDVSPRSLHAIARGYQNAQGIVPIVTISMSPGLLKFMIELGDKHKRPSGQIAEVP